MKITNPKSGAALGILALILIAFFSNWLVSLIPAGNKGLDLTEDRVHTISNGTKAILSELDAPVVINYYATRKSTFLPRELKLYMKKVDSFLKQYETLSNGNLKLVYLDPQPDTDAEDAANLDGISGQRLNDENIFFGLSVQCLDKKSTIPFLNPASETMLEYELSSAIAEVAQAKKPVIGLISALPVAGSGMPQFPGQPPQPQAWLLHQQLSQQYEIRDLGMNPGEINTEDISLLLVMHPAGITPEAEFAIDQYVLNGGTMIATLDAFNILAAQSQPRQQNPMMPPQGGGIPTSSTFPTLLKAWGVEFESTKTLGDSRYRTALQQGVGVSLLSLTPEAFPLKDDIATQGIQDLFVPFPGGFSLKTTPAGLESTVMLQSSSEAAFVDTQRASRLDPQLVYEMKPSGEQYPLMLRLTGQFPTAFPEGNPTAQTEEEGQNDKTTPESLQNSLRPGTVFLLADTDLFADQFCFSVQNMMGMRVVSPQGNNAALLQNLVDMAAGSKHLIGARSRASSRRPFSVIQEMEAEFEQVAGQKMQELEAEEQKVIARISDLQASKQNGNQLLLSPEQQREIAELRAQQVNFSRQIRGLEKDLQKQKDALAARVTLANIGFMPLLVLLVGMIVYTRRQSATRAK